MSLESKFHFDLKKERKLSVLLDSYYQSKLKQYDFERVTDIELQYHGVDVVFKHKKTDSSYNIDEKAQLDYLNEDLPTFAFELSYLKNGKLKLGWLFDDNKTTDFYALVTAIYCDYGEYSSCKITLVNRKKLLYKLNSVGFNPSEYVETIKNHGRHNVAALNPKTQGYLFLSSKNKSEQPLNLVLRLDWLIESKIAKRLI